MFILFSMYCMMPVPVKWCTVCCVLTGLVHVALMLVVTAGDGQDQGPSVSVKHTLELFNLQKKKNQTTA